jgi:Fic family protein
MKPRSEVIAALATLHYQILLMHPFFDGNGRVARLLIDQAAHELLGAAVSKEMTADRSIYYAALEAADHGYQAPRSIDCCKSFLALWKAVPQEDMLPSSCEFHHA